MTDVKENNLSDDEFLERYVEDIRRINSLVRSDDISGLRSELMNQPEFLNRSVFKAGSDSLLGFAAKEGRLEVCKLLLDLGVGLEKQSESGLEAAASQGQFEVVDFLVRSGAQIDGPSHAIISPLLSAVTFGHLKVVAYLLDAGADINRYHLRLYQTALDLAMVWGHRDIEELLRSRGALSVFEGTGISTHRYAPMLQSIREKFGDILPASLHTAATGVEIHLALANKKKHKILFTTGLSKRFGTNEELYVILDDTWSPYDRSGANMFPVNLLSRLSEDAAEQPRSMDGVLIQPTDQRFSDLHWPEKLAAIQIGRCLRDQCVIEPSLAQPRIDMKALVPHPSTAKAPVALPTEKLDKLGFGKLAMHL